MPLPGALEYRPETFAPVHMVIYTHGRMGHHDVLEIVSLWIRM